MKFTIRETSIRDIIRYRYFWRGASLGFGAPRGVAAIDGKAIGRGHEKGALSCRR
ncbi:hypothetical protein MesoLj131b_77080 (plasmid) [Mesorhizobium sp. 131-2-5]|uniref:hypothetical protein n=1 Tax=Mesorhizobium sp. 131-2-5 TaxID=2744519 RepID=UPI0018EE30DC|nr:hypothetical protein [Mesorhizobium sp. 131-2-5]BCH05709.1 hypothetical protein MesoLj131b_77080 [Mesorhizobium sp. 131-2-5]